MNTPWVAFTQYGCYYRLLNCKLQAMPMHSDGGCNTEESVDVDWYCISPPEKDICKKAALQLMDWWYDGKFGAEQ